MRDGGNDGVANRNGPSARAIWSSVFWAMRMLGSRETLSPAFFARLRRTIIRNCSWTFGESRPLGVLETFNLVSNYPSTQGSARRLWIGRKTANWFEFYETVSVNRGYHNKVFTDMEKAIEWLIG